MRDIDKIVKFSHCKMTRRCNAELVKRSRAFISSCLTFDPRCIFYHDDLTFHRNSMLPAACEYRRTKAGELRANRDPRIDVLSG